ncbi:MAG: Gfo/Idh/MocA family oxidoreductase [Planctomycetes bacterium]|nr:Gfo/Idh/MocA family oxidoreductase [Planctomycetota bacterium]MBM4078970.1 Gfo/Idh/MocA family oxidoreductase [Planctomycetota bacterium]
MSDRIRIGVVSAGGMAHAHMRAAVTLLDVELRAVADPRLDAAAKAAQTYHIPFHSARWQDVVERDDVDMVIVASPDWFHAEQSVAALNAGKHVLCEKPMTATVEQAKQITDAAKRSRAYFMIGQVCRFAPGFAKTKQLIDKGAIGELFYIESEYAHNYAHAQGVGGWRKSTEHLREPYLGGGCHAVDLVRWIGGNPTEVFAYANHKCLTDWPVNDCTIAVYQFPNGVIGKVFVSVGCNRRYTMRSCFYGTTGTIISDNTTPWITLYQKEDSPPPFPGQEGSRGVGIEIPVPALGKGVADEIMDLVRCIKAKTPPSLNAKEGASTVLACLSAVKSAKEHRPVPLDYSVFE